MKPVTIINVNPIHRATAERMSALLAAGRETLTTMKYSAASRDDVNALYHGLCAATEELDRMMRLETILEEAEASAQTFLNGATAPADLEAGPAEAMADVPNLAALPAAD